MAASCEVVIDAGSPPAPKEPRMRVEFPKTWLCTVLECAMDSV